MDKNKQYQPSFTDKLLIATQLSINTNTEIMATLTNLIASGAGANGMKRSHYDCMRRDIKVLFEKNSKAIDEVFKDE